MNPYMNQYPVHPPPQPNPYQTIPHYPPQFAPVPPHIYEEPVPNTGNSGRTLNSNSSDRYV